MEKDSQIWVSCDASFPEHFSTKLSFTHYNNWDIIKDIFKHFNSVKCSWMKEILKYDSNTKFNLNDHNECFLAKLKYDLLINGTEDMLEYYNKPSKWLKVSHDFFVEMCRHKCLSYFNTQETTEFFGYVDKCLLELSKMRTTVHDGVTLYDFVVQQKQYFLKGIESITNEDVKNFPIYGDVIKCSILMIKERKKLMKQLQDVQMVCKNTQGALITLDYGSMQHLSEFLSNLDLISVLDAFSYE